MVIFIIFHEQLSNNDVSSLASPTKFVLFEHLLAKPQWPYLPERPSQHKRENQVKKKERNLHMSAEDQFGSGRETHILLFPCPAQGHVTCMLQIAELLALSNIHVTFLNTDHVHRRLLSFADIQSRSAAYPTLRFETFSNGLPDDDPRNGDVVEHIKQVKLKAKPQLMEICLDASGKPRFSCIIGDGIFGSLTNELGQELGIPVVFFRTVSACCLWAYFCAPKLFESNELPIRGMCFFSSTSFPSSF